MKFLAAVLSCLILTLSSGAGGIILLPSVPSGSAEVSGGCGCCCQCGEQDAGQEEGTDAMPHKGCPFCISNTCPGFTPAFTVVEPASLAEIHAGECLFIQHKYVSPSTGGIWQPPRTV